MKYIQQLRGDHVLVRVHNTAVVTYMNCGRLHLCLLNRLAQQVLLWVQHKFLSLRAIYILEHMNVRLLTLKRFFFSFLMAITVLL